MTRINWKKVWPEFYAYCNEMGFTCHLGNAWLYCEERIKWLVTAELRRGAKKKERRK